MKVLIVDDVKGWRDHHSQVIKSILGECEIITADCARMGYDLLMEHNIDPFDIIITDMQMEADFEPKYAGEWFIEQIKTFKNYLNTKIIIISAAYNIKHIAENYGVFAITNNTALNFPQAYEEIVK